MIAAVMIGTVPVIALLLPREDGIAAEGIADAGEAAAAPSPLLLAGGGTAVSGGDVSVITLLSFICFGRPVPAGERTA